MRKLAGLMLAAVVMGFGVTAAEAAKIVVSINKVAQKMTVTVDGDTEYKWPVSTGGPGYDTPSGTYKPFRMEAEHFSEEWDNAPMPHSIFFTQLGHAIHGTTHVKSLGRRASHGCVRLAPANAATLFALIEKNGMSNTTVSVTGGLFDGGFASSGGMSNGDSGFRRPFFFNFGTSRNDGNGSGVTVVKGGQKVTATSKPPLKKDAKLAKADGKPVKKANAKDKKKKPFLAIFGALN